MNDTRRVYLSRVYKLTKLLLLYYTRSKYKSRKVIKQTSAAALILASLIFYFIFSTTFAINLQQTAPSVFKIKRTIYMAISTVLTRRNSIATSAVPPKLTLPSSDHFSSFPLDLHIFPAPSYTSLKDIIPCSVPNSPAPSAAAASSSGYQIAIRNRLVKQAAWAYLQPMSTSPGSESRSFFKRTWFSFSEFLTNNYVVRAVTRSFHWLLRVVWVR